MNKQSTKITKPFFTLILVIKILYHYYFIKLKKIFFIFEQIIIFDILIKNPFF